MRSSPDDIVRSPLHDGNLSESELLQALLEVAQHTHSAGMTCEEIADKLGWSRRRVLDHLRILKRQGLLESVRVYRQAVDGYMRLVPAYRLFTKSVDGSDGNDRT